MPVRFVDFQHNPDSSGLSDINAGFKWAMVADPNRFVTFQFRTYAPTGAADKGLGTGHVSVEPALLFFQRLNDWLVLEANSATGYRSAARISPATSSAAASAWGRRSIRIAASA